MIKLLMAGFVLGILVSAADSPSAVGDWLGTLSFNGVNLRIALHIKQTAASLAGTMDSLDQGALGIPLDHVSFSDGKLSLRIAALQASYEGKLEASGKSLSGTFTQGGVSIPLDLKPTSEPVAIKRPQEPKPPFPYLGEEVGYENGDVHLAGTFTKPKGDGPFPAVLLITGSGQQNRDEEILGHKPFWVLADYLTRRGIAVLRVDDRGIGGSTGVFRTSTTEDFATDVTAGVKYLLGRSDVDTRHVGLIGHSEGGIIAPMVAAKMPQVAFIVMLAGTALPGDQIVADQVYKANILAGASPEKAAQARDFEAKLLSIDKTEPNAEAREKKMLALAEGEPAVQKTIREQMPALQSPWYRFFLAYDPRTALIKVKCPVLALDGAKDTQVDAQQNIPLIQAALAEGGNRDVTVKIVPGVNHLFQEAGTGAFSEYATIEQTITPEVLDTIATWIEKRMR
jgi:pimeloyl-ACP methyl ester carboxylesterase